MRERILYIDYLKIFAIFLVVLGHTCQYYSSNIEVAVQEYAIWPYNMPLFAVLSGLFFQKEQKWNIFLKKKFIQIGLPFIIWCFIVTIVIRGIEEIYLHFVEDFEIHFRSWPKWFFIYMIEYGYWFLRALFLSFLLAFFSIKVFKSNIVFGTVFSILLLYSLSFTGILPKKYFDGFIFLYPFFCVGIIFNRYKEFIFKYSSYFLFVSAILFFVLFSFWEGSIDAFYFLNTSMIEKEGYGGIIGWMVLYKTLYRFLIGTSASIMFILVFRSGSRYMSEIPILQSVGRNTLGIYILHGFTYKIFAPPSSQILFNNFFLSFVACFLISIAIIIVDNFIVNYTSKSNKWIRLFLWGKR